MDNRKPSEKQSTQGSSPHPIAKPDASLVTMTRLWKAVRVNGSIVKRIPKSNNHSLPSNSALFYAVGMQKLEQNVNRFIYCGKSLTPALSEGEGELINWKLAVSKVNVTFPLAMI
ncbi:hypothetical protein [Pedobacter alpinus]|uniref:Uncharacterized protein n=1 Tax=Pedobacter alpinus TaxID=1590643 RepID=A0ABW5TR85_9SPHI